VARLGQAMGIMKLAGLDLFFSLLFERCFYSFSFFPFMHLSNYCSFSTIMKRQGTCHYLRKSKKRSLIRYYKDACYRWLLQLAEESEPCFPMFFFCSSTEFHELVAYKWPLGWVTSMIMGKRYWPCSSGL
jgi:hypothetical protein